MLKNIERYFIIVGLICVLLAMFNGFWMGVNKMYTMVSMHAHLGLIGWVSMSLFAVIYWLGLAVKDGWAIIHFYVTVSGIFLFTVGIYIEDHVNGNIVAVASGSLLVILSFIIFLVNVLRAKTTEHV